MNERGIIKQYFIVIISRHQYDVNIYYAELES